MENNISWDKMISASSVGNYLLKDTLSDWLKHYHIVDVHNIHNKKYLLKLLENQRIKIMFF